MRKLIPTAILFLTACAHLHHVQLGEIEDNPAVALIPFEIKVSETGVDLKEASQIAKSFKSKSGDDAGAILDTIALFQIGPRTGAPVYNKSYAEKMIYMIHEKCPTGKITGLSSIRETREYPVIKGEIVKITGFCMKEKT